jgi:HEPN domain-containing protein
MSADGVPPRSGGAFAERLVVRAHTDLAAARLLAEREYFRVAVDVARGAARAALRVFLGTPRQHRSSTDLAYLLSLALAEREDLRRLHDLDLTRLITQYAFDEEADELDARHAIEAAQAIVAFVASDKGAT